MSSNNNSIITVNNLGKRYRIGTKINPEGLDNFRDAILNIARAPFRNLRRLRKLTNFEGGGDGEASDIIWALKDVSFGVNKGEVVGIIGRNGSGKSTLLKILSRITEPTEGCVELRGRVSSLLEVGTGFHRELTGRENIYLNGSILGMKKWEIDEKFDEIVTFSEIEKFIDTPVKHYSSGMYVRLAFAVAAHLEPEIFLVDEVLAVGDAAFQKKCLGKMGDIAKAGRTVLFVSHNMDAVLNLCDKCIFLKKGSIGKIGATNEVVQYYYQSLTDIKNDHVLKSAVRHDSPIIINEVKLYSKSGESYKFDVMDTITVRADFEFVRQYKGPIFLGMQIRTATGLPVFTSTNVDTMIEQSSSNLNGILKINGHTEIDIPSQILNSGMYEIHFVAFEPGGTLHYVVSNIYFEVFDKGSWVSKNFTTQRQGIILAKLPWKIEYAKIRR